MDTIFSWFSPASWTVSIPVYIPNSYSLHGTHDLCTTGLTQNNTLPPYPRYYKPKNDFYDSLPVRPTSLLARNCKGSTWWSSIEWWMKTTNCPEWHFAIRKYFSYAAHLSAILHLLHNPLQLPLNTLTESPHLHLQIVAWAQGLLGCSRIWTSTSNIWEKWGSLTPPRGVNAFFTGKSYKPT